MKIQAFSIFLLFISLSNISKAKNLGLPIITSKSQFYYVPQVKLEKKDPGPFSSMGSNSQSGSYFESWSGFFGCKRCEFENVILVNKKTKSKKPLFLVDTKITSFFTTSESDIKKNFPSLIFIRVSKPLSPDQKKASGDDETSDFYIAKSDGSQLTNVLPSGFDIIDYEFDMENRKLILLLRKIKSSLEQIVPSHPYIVDLQKVEVAVPLIDGN